MTVSQQSHSLTQMFCVIKCQPLLKCKTQELDLQRHHVCFILMVDDADVDLVLISR